MKNLIASSALALALANAQAGNLNFVFVGDPPRRANETTAAPWRGRSCASYPACRSRHREYSSVRLFCGGRAGIVVS